MIFPGNLISPRGKGLQLRAKGRKGRGAAPAPHLQTWEQVEAGSHLGLVSEVCAILLS